MQIPRNDFVPFLMAEIRNGSSPLVILEKMRRSYEMRKRKAFKRER
jgi:hypothetical protein